MRKSIALFIAMMSAGGCTSPADNASDLGRACVPVAAASEVVSAKDDYGTMQGTLEIPSGCQGMPVVVILSGSGPEDRDGNTPGYPDRTDMYKQLALGLRDAGFAALRFDDPGVAASASALPASESQITYEMEVDAAGRWLPILHGDARFGAVVAAGHSQGSLTAILLAQRGGVDAVVSLEGEGRPIDQVLREQLQPRLSSDQRVTLDQILAKLRAGTLAGPQQAPFDQLFRESSQPYLISWMKYDPAVEIAKVSARTLIVQGGTDAQVTVEDSQRLAAAKPDAQSAFIADMCHVLKQAAVADISTQTAQYSDPSIPLHPMLLPDVVAFLRPLEMR